MSNFQQQISWSEAVFRQKDRLRTSINWFPYPFLISASLIMLFTESITQNLNARIGNPSEILSFPAPPETEGAIWISMTPIDEKLVVTTDDRSVYEMSLEPTSEELIPLLNFLQMRVREDILASGLSKTASQTQTTLVIAADQRLTFSHFRPLMYTFSKVGITKFAFETLIPNIEQAQREDTAAFNIHVK